MTPAADHATTGNKNNVVEGAERSSKPVGTTEHYIDIAGETFVVVDRKITQALLLLH